MVFDNGEQRYDYVMTDHLGNTRLLYSDIDGDGIPQMPREVLQETHYYPFGMKMKGPWITNGAADGTKYQYNGIEHVDDFDLDINVAAYRVLDPAIGRWWSVDPKAEAMMGISPYASMNNSPVVYADPMGDLPIAPIIALGVQSMLVGGASSHAQGGSFIGGALKAGAFYAASSLASAGIGGIFKGVGSFGKEVLRASFHGASGGLFSLAQGGSFGSCFVGGALSSGVGAALDGLSPALQILGGGLSGSFGSLIAGGDFGRGFYQGAIIAGLNHLSHGESTQEQIWSEASNIGDYYYTYPEGVAPNDYNPKAGEIATWTGVYDDNKTTFKIQKMRSIRTRRVHTKLDFGSTITYATNNNWLHPDNISKGVAAGIVSRMLKTTGWITSGGFLLQGSTHQVHASYQQWKFFYGYD